MLGCSSGKAAQKVSHISVSSLNSWRTARIRHKATDNAVPGQNGDLHARRKSVLHNQVLSENGQLNEATFKSTDDNIESDKKRKLP